MQNEEEDRERKQETELLREQEGRKGKEENGPVKVSWNQFFRIDDLFISSDEQGIVRIDDPEFLGQEEPLKEGTASHFSILAYKVRWTEEPGALQSVGSQTEEA